MATSNSLHRSHSDLTITTLIAIILLSSTFAVDIIAGTTNPVNKYFNPSPKNNVNITQPQKITEDVIEINGYTEEGKSSDIDLGTLPNNTTKINATLVWVDDYGSNDDFAISLYINTTEIDKKEGTQGQLIVEASGFWSEGSYNFKISAINCPGVMPNLPVDRDNGNSWQLKVVVTHYQ